MNQILTALYEVLPAAKAKMPPSMPLAASADMLLTLLFWKLMSDWVCGRAQRSPNHYQGYSAKIHIIRQRNHIAFNEASLFEACVWARPQDAYMAVRDSLSCWISLQTNPMLNSLLRPERFDQSHPNYTLFAPTGLLAELMELIGGMSFDQYGTIDPDTPLISTGEIFSKAAEILEISPQPLPHEVTQLIVALLNPRPIDIIYDPACSDPQLLLACATAMRKNVPNHQMLFLGNEANVNRLALAEMKLLAHGLQLFILAGTDALNPTGSIDFPDTTTQIASRPAAKVVLTCIPLQAHDWDYASAANDPRFPLSAPKDSRIALIWHCLAQMKDEHSRMGMILPLTLLDSEEGLVLRRHLVQKSHLEALVELPGTQHDGQELTLMVLRPLNPFSQFAFISSKVVMPSGSKRKQPDSAQYGSPAILAAYSAFRGMQNAPPYMAVIGHKVLAAYEYQFNLSAYAEWLRTDALPAAVHH
jgi:N-6 DNA Methylase